jgi:hypothetical protein
MEKIILLLDGPIPEPELQLLKFLGTVGAVTEKSVEFSFPLYLQFSELIRAMEDAIERQESDQGDWLTAKYWREAKPHLLNKLRKAMLRGVP